MKQARRHGTQLGCPKSALRPEASPASCPSWAPCQIRVSRTQSFSHLIEVRRYIHTSASKVQGCRPPFGLSCLCSLQAVPVIGAYWDLPMQFLFLIRTGLPNLYMQHKAELQCINLWLVARSFTFLNFAAGAFSRGPSGLAEASEMGYPPIVVLVAWVHPICFWCRAWFQEIELLPCS